MTKAMMNMIEAAKNNGGSLRITDKRKWNTANRLGASIEAATIVDVQFLTSGRGYLVTVR